MSNIETPLVRPSGNKGELLDLEDAQSISGKNIDPAKLRTLLRIKFGGGYDIHVSTLHQIRSMPR